jgi:thiol:disulfide interchange protein DsbC
MPRSILRPCAYGAALLAAAFACTTALADEATIRKNFASRLPQFPKIDEVRKSPIAGLYEVRVGTELFYTDENGDHVIDGGQIIATKTRENLTQARLDELNRIDFASLPLKDAIVWKQGNGARKIAVFADPNCGYCKRLERDLNNLKDVTVYTFLFPILGGDSPEKSRAIWCSKDATRVWRSWMLEGVTPPRTMGPCDDGALARNEALGRRFRINGTPAIIFEDGKRVPGAMPAEQIEKQLVASAARKP